MKRKNKIIIVLFFVMLSVFLVVPQEKVSAATSVPGKVKMVGVYPDKTDNYLRVVWDRTSNATNYVIYIRKNGTSSWKKLASEKNSREAYVPFVSGKDIEIGREYFCTVRAYNSKTKKYGAFDKTGIKFRVLPEPVSLTSVSMNKAKTGVVLRWQTYNGKQIKRGDFYLVFRKQSGKWKQIAKVSSDTTTYTDTKFLKNKANTYTVKSYNSKTKSGSDYDKTGVTIDLTNRSPKTVYTSSQTEVILKGKTLSCAFNNVTSGTIKWYSSNPSVAKAVSAGKNKGKIKGLKNGTAQITATLGSQMRRFNVVVASGNDFVNKWTRNIASEVKKSTSDPEKQLLLVSQYLVGGFQYANVFDLPTVIWDQKGNCYSTGQVMVKIYQALGYKAKVRSAIRDSKKRYPSNFIMGSDHYNVEVVARGRTYYLDASPESGVTYISSKTGVLEAYFNFGTGWIRTQ